MVADGQLPNNEIIQYTMQVKQLCQMRIGSNNCWPVTAVLPVLDEKNYASLHNQPGLILYSNRHCHN
jgi:hypothetical protein